MTLTCLSGRCLRSSWHIGWPRCYLLSISGGMRCLLDCLHLYLFHFNHLSRMHPSSPLRSLHHDHALLHVAAICRRKRRVGQGFEFIGLFRYINKAAALLALTGDADTDKRLCKACLRMEGRGRYCQELVESPPCSDSACSKSLTFDCVVSFIF